LLSTMTRDIRRLADVHGVSTDLSNAAGCMIDAGPVARLAATNFRFVGGSEWDGIWLREQADRLGLRVWIKESTDELHNVAVQGPASRDLLSRSEEHTSELQSRGHLVCRLLLEKKKANINIRAITDPPTLEVAT